MDQLERTLARMGWRTPDGSPVAREAPYGATVVVARRGPAGDAVLLLHRAHGGGGDEGEWAWGPPAGARLPGESLEACARRELVEETGLELEPVPTEAGSAAWGVFTAVAPPDAKIRLSAEHDRYAWLNLEDAVACCRPEFVAEQLRAVARA